MSSNPTTPTSLGTFMSFSLSASKTPIAIWSLCAIIEVGLLFLSHNRQVTV
jgi:hypothetical protein